MLFRSAGGANVPTKTQISDKVAKKHGVSGKTIRNRARRLASTGSLQRVTGSGRTSVWRTDNVNEQLTAWASTKKYSFSLAEACAFLGTVGDESPSPPTVMSLLQHFGWRSYKRRMVPLLTPEHITARLKYAKNELLYLALLKSGDGADNAAIVHQDEKWFYAEIGRGHV